MKKYIAALVLLSLTAWCRPLEAQQVNSQYFLNNVPTRHFLNPAFQPESNIYISLPALGYTQLSLMNNSLSMQDVVYRSGSQTVWFLHPGAGSKDKFMKTLRDPLSIRPNVDINLLGFGFRTNIGYFTFSLREKVEGGLFLPKDLFRLAIKGTGMSGGSFDMKGLGMDLSAYTEAAFGFTREINDQWQAGGKVKFLYGTANASTDNSDLILYSAMDKLTLKGSGTLNISSPAQQVVKNNSFDPEFPSDLNSWIRPQGLGGALDLGVVYKPLKELTLSFAANDLGFIGWKRNAQNLAYNVDYEFQGVEGDGLDLDSFSGILDSIVSGIENSFDYNTGGTERYRRFLSPKFNLGAEYAFFDNMLSVGMVYHHSRHFNDLTAAVTGRPAEWFNMSLSYSILNGRFGSIGTGIGLRSGVINWHFSADYLSLNNAALSIESIPFRIPVPYKTKGLNFAAGINIVIGSKKDQDRDGVKDKFDLCPDTPRRVKVDENGCPIDSDGDGVPDYLDKCPDTPREAYGFVDEHGCPLDSDGDGVPDYLDKCPDTPQEAYSTVDADGCPADSDGDGVPDYLDQCPDTPEGARGFVDEYGCLKDSDGDGVPDYLDKCPDTPAEAYGLVDADGCPTDSDGDGVPDYMDQCPDTPAEARGLVGADGCPLDTDGDGIPDYLDDCPKTPGTAENNGCPEIKKEVRSLFQKALQGIQFETGKDVIKKSSHGILDQIARVMSENPSYKIEIQGHTDNVGKKESNQLLSEKRAASVRDYLLKKGIDPLRITAIGYGDENPVDTNSTAAGRAKNRRVEFIVSFEEVSYE